MTLPAQLRIRNVREETDGSPLVFLLAAIQIDAMPVESYVDFNDTGGTFVIEPGTANEEVGTYTSYDMATDTLLGINRPDPKVHIAGSFVQSGLTASKTKIVDGYVDGDTSNLSSGIEVRAEVIPYLKKGPRIDELAETVWVAPVDDSEDVYVISPPINAKPLFGDLESMPPTGGGDGSLPPVDGPTGPQPPPGQGYEDGEVPSEAPVITAVGALQSIHVRMLTIANSSVVTYKVYCSKVNGFTPGLTTYVGSITLSGTPDFDALLIIKDFPTGHVLDGTADDPPVAGTNYYIKAVASDGTGDGPVSNQVMVTPVKIATVVIDNGAITEALLAANAVTTTKIADGSIETPKLVAGSVTTAKIATGAVTANEIAANTITAAKIAAGTITTTEIAANTIVAGDIATSTITGDRIAGTTITANKLSVGNLEAISAHLGNIISGTITGVTITGGLVRSSSSGSRIELAGVNPDTLNWYDSSGLTAAIQATASLLLIDAVATIRIGGTATALELMDPVKIASNIGFFNATPVSKRTDPGNHSVTTGTDNDGTARAKINAVMQVLRDYNLI